MNVIKSLYAHARAARASIQFGRLTELEAGLAKGAARRAMDEAARQTGRPYTLRSDHGIHRGGWWFHA